MSLLSDEIKNLEVGDKRITKRSISILETLGAHPQKSIPAACNGWSETKAAYRLFDNNKVTAQGILEPHYECTAKRMGEYPTVLCVQDTSEMDYTGKNDIQGLGPLNYESRRGLYIHPTLAITPDRVCLGIIDSWNWSRETGSLGKDKVASRPIEEKESYRWLEGYLRTCDRQTELVATQLVYVADREGDIYEIFEAHDQQAKQGNAADWLIRGQYDRRLENGEHLLESVEKTTPLGEIEFTLPAGRGRVSRPVVQQIYSQRITLKGVYRKQGCLQDVDITIILAKENNPPKGEKAIEWTLLTNQLLNSYDEAAERVQWYLCRWQIEVFFKVLKSGCKVEELQLENMDRLEPALAFYMIIAWRVLYLTIMGRSCPEIPCDVIFDSEEWQAVYIVTHRKTPPDIPPSLNEMVRMVATFGGFLNRKGDGEPGVQTLWVGLQRARDFASAIQASKSLAIE